MSALAAGHALRDSATLLRRNLRHAQRYPAMTYSVVLMPLLMLLLFTYVYGGALEEGIGGGTYIDYIAPGIILMAATAGAVTTAVSVCVDMTEGIVNRFRSMAISRSAFLAGHVIGGVLQTLLAVVVVVVAALLIGFRPDATVPEWLAAAGLLVMLISGMTWISAAIGLIAKTPETASNIPMPLQFLPLIGSAIVPTASMPDGFRWFAENQPFSPVIETLRGLLLGTPIGGSGVVALAWCTALNLAGFLWAHHAFRRLTRR
ncbi:ABC transporter permease [Streptomyces carpaticus]|uniref:Transport permease protein n=1 Tax=Streptomyces carpaticus TaxID=285558 RepID=A0ABV4ZL99_9ACTN